MTVIERVVQTWRYLAVPRGDERHGERTAEILRRDGADADLVLAGLLHDRAKPQGTRLWHRIAAVLFDVIAPSLRERYARGGGTFALYLDHARRGAELARREGRSDRVVELIARHHQPPSSEDERRLARADRKALP